MRVTSPNPEGEAAEAKQLIDFIYTTFPHTRSGHSGQQETVLADPEQLQRIQKIVLRRLFHSGKEVEALLEALFEEAQHHGLLGALLLARCWLLSKIDIPQARVLRALDLFVTHHPLALAAHLNPPPLHLQSRFVRGNDHAEEDVIDRAWIPPKEPCEMSLAYWREDYHRNLSHFKWHIVFFHGGIPNPTAPHSGSRRLAMDRQGELFLYAHQQIMARYEAERLAFGLPDVVPFSDYDEIIADGYEPPGRMLRENPHWPFPYLPRPAGHGLIEEIPGYDGRDTTVENLKRIEANICQAIEEGRIPGTDIELTENLLGNLLEVNVEGRRISTDLYGVEGLHNGIHDNFSLIGRGSHTTNYGVMGTTQDSSRDPIFYRVHRHLDDLRQRFSDKQPPNDLFAHQPQGVAVASLTLVHEGAALKTTLGPSEFLYERGKLRHAPFSWRLTLTISDTACVDRVTARIFICPKQSCHERRSWIEMDKFSIPITPGKAVSLVRADVESSVARKENEAGAPEGEGRWCDCGWPQNLMMPAGRPEGMEFVACVLLTANDLAVRRCRRCGSNDEIIACGSLLGGGKHPDALGMGYPFNRRFAQDGAILEVLSQLPHARLHAFTVVRCQSSTLLSFASAGQPQ